MKVKYTNKRGAAKANIRYSEHRPGKENAKITRTLWGVDGKIERNEAYTMIDEAEKGSTFFRIIFSPDPAQEDSEKDLDLRDITAYMMETLEKRTRQSIAWVAATHADHAPHRHVHMLAVIRGKLQRDDLAALTRLSYKASVSFRCSFLYGGIMSASIRLSDLIPGYIERDGQNTMSVQTCCTTRLRQLVYY